MNIWGSLPDFKSSGYAYNSLNASSGYQIDFLIDSVWSNDVLDLRLNGSCSSYLNSIVILEKYITVIVLWFVVLQYSITHTACPSTWCYSSVLAELINSTTGDTTFLSITVNDTLILDSIILLPHQYETGNSDGVSVGTPEGCDLSTRWACNGPVWNFLVPSTAAVQQTILYFCLIRLASSSSDDLPGCLGLASLT